jgi:hypothetical protein
MSTAGGELERPTLIVIDGADLYFRSAGGLVRATIHSAVRVRLLLLARDRSGWWKAFNSESDNNANGFDHGDLVKARFFQTSRLLEAPLPGQQQAVDAAPRETDRPS